MEPGALETGLREQGFRLIAGADEVGRGALAGPLVACAVILSPEDPIEGVRDSKLLTPLARGRLAAEIRRRAVALSLVRVTPGRIDRNGLHRSNLWALRRAIARLRPAPEYALSDGFPVARLPMPALAVKRGDRMSPSVAAASIVAKVTRDRAMARLGRRHPAYGFERNKGYGTAEHWAALRAHGPSEVHRRSFTGVGAVQLVLEPDALDVDELLAPVGAP